MLKYKRTLKREIKLAYIEQILLKKIPIEETAKELNVRKATVYDWVKKYKENPKDFMPESGQVKICRCRNIENTQRKQTTKIGN